MRVAGDVRLPLVEWRGDINHVATMRPIGRSVDCASAALERGKRPLVPVDAHHGLPPISLVAAVRRDKPLAFLWVLMVAHFEHTLAVDKIQLASAAVGGSAPIAAN